MNLVNVIAVAATASTLSPAVAQLTDIDSVHKFSWAENTGWMNWRDANASLNGVRLESTFLAGWIWSGSTGWIHVGNGSPADGLHYANADDSDYGVNIDPAVGDLFGLAWGENIGWINFDTRAALAAFGDQASFDSAAGRFRGFAWSENVGWINLDDATHYVATRCIANWNADGIFNTADFVAYLNDFNAAMAGQPFTYSDPDIAPPIGVLNTADFVAYLNAFTAGCP